LGQDGPLKAQLIQAGGEHYLLANQIIYLNHQHGWGETTHSNVVNVMHFLRRFFCDNLKSLNLGIYNNNETLYFTSAWLEYKSLLYLCQAFFHFSALLVPFFFLPIFLCYLVTF